MFSKDRPTLIGPRRPKGRRIKGLERPKPIASRSNIRYVAPEPAARIFWPLVLRPATCVA
jgi:hypothetical protein